MVINEGDTYVITGIKAGVTLTAVPLCLEADTWFLGQTVEHLIQNSLFIWALKALQERDSTRKLSFFQIAGIHGYPYQPWDEAKSYYAATLGQGYCTHNSLLFPCWHRPYMTLYEQALYEIMVTEIIPHGLVYDVPLIAKESTINVLDYKQPDSQIHVPIDNPMYKFVMPGKAQMGSFGINDIQDGVTQFYTIPYSRSIATSRWAPFEPQGGTVSEAWVDGTWYNKPKDSFPLAEMVYRLFEPEYIKTFAQFATTRKPMRVRKLLDETRNPTPYLNLEFIHNNVHNWTGGINGPVGHMGDVPVAGFDPIFFMHHCNIDRQFAIWQALNEKNPNNWFDHLKKPYDDDGTWAIVQGEKVTPKTPLAPFHKNAQGDCFNSDDIRNWMSLYYSYPELQPWLDKYKTEGQFDEAKYVADIRLQLQRLYQPLESPTVSSWLTDSLKVDVIVNITYDRFAFNGLPYTIYLFLGDKSAFASTTSSSSDSAVPPHKHPQHVGFVYTFSNPAFGAAAGAGSRGCQKCLKESESDEDTLSSAQIPLTAVLVARQKLAAATLGAEESESLRAAGIHGLEGMEEDKAERYLADHLHWSVKTGSGMDIEVPEDDQSFFEVKVYHRAARFDNHEADAPPYKPLEKATQTKPGGFLYKGSASGTGTGTGTTATLPTL
ncbi:common central domain of tyrosinase-domain-containing protein [Echria macrotheca]|uniref:tyrosinase n=1 Tax=Echria macrotheca TaxID=438768 RepID=A0AAJ0BKB6_9PEZI|nr:common central domain of tyrosinase-domain-containing protein [Echria macrotheca]